MSTLLRNDYDKERRGVKTDDLTEKQLFDFYDDMMPLEQAGVAYIQRNGWSFRDAIKWYREFRDPGRSSQLPGINWCGK